MDKKSKHQSPIIEFAEDVKKEPQKINYFKGWLLNMPVIIASVSDYANGYIGEWAKENNISEEQALDEILTSIRKDSEELWLL